MLALGTGLLIALEAHAATRYLILAYLIYGAGAGLVSAPITHTALSGMPRDQAGVAGAIASTCRQTGAAVGVAIVGAVIAASSSGFVHQATPPGAVLAGCGIAVVLLGIISNGRWAQATANRTGQRLTADAQSAAQGTP